MPASKKRKTITFQPNDEVRALMDEALRLDKGPKRGARTRILNEVLRSSIASGKKGVRR